MSRRMVRINELLRQEIAELLFRLLNEAGVDLTAITITRVETSPDLHTARVMVSIRDHRDERPQMLRLLEAHRREIQTRINRDIRMKYTPHLSFHLDESIEQGDRVLAIISKIEQQGAPQPDEKLPAPQPLAPG